MKKLFQKIIYYASLKWVKEAYIQVYLVRKQNYKLYEFLQYADGKNDLDVIKEKLGVSNLELNKILKF